MFIRFKQSSLSEAHLDLAAGRPTLSAGKCHRLSRVPEPSSTEPSTVYGLHIPLLRVTIVGALHARDMVAAFVVCCESAIRSAPQCSQSEPFPIASQWSPCSRLTQEDLYLLLLADLLGCRAHQGLLPSRLNLIWWPKPFVIVMSSNFQLSGHAFPINSWWGA